MSEQINAKVDFQEYEFKIVKIEDDIIILEDKSESLGVGNTVTTYKKVKSDNNIDYLVPTFEYEVIDSAKGLVTCRMSYPYIDKIDKPTKSNIAKSTMIISSSGSQFFRINSSNMELAGNEVSIENLDKMVVPFIGSGFRKPLVLENEVIEKKSALINGSGMFRKKLEIAKNKSDLVIKPEYKIKLKNHKVKGYSKIDTYTIVAVLSTYKGEKLLNKKGLSQDIVVTIPLKHGDNMLKYELLKAISNLFKKIASQL